MKSSSHAPSATSLPRSPRDDVDARSTRYLVTMGIRVVCFILMVVITPYGWYTWLFGAAAIFLPYIAVVSANVGQEARRNRREDPEPALPAAPSTPRPNDTQVIRIQETRSLTGDEKPRRVDDDADPTA
ncbi:DUF3099 domain-containing protein [Microbacterium trichothecenolyticum]|uniref:DUF3099 domain-containing protein n=1 Tax=Microbacterium ureisolvens TaxID=2781186 RepID=A0ABS7HW19_9MICO|nr:MULTISPECIES: DUF3099 domain-containing protein [Microbacterium]MBW9108752.1 DUF3099 domain-containing protein [Microbacterium ureisolvens]MBW9120732.1 DUF3099 domain-containing protein [Microbacterium trichothecenolyticum]